MTPTNSVNNAAEHETLFKWSTQVFTLITFQTPKFTWHLSYTSEISS